MEAEVQKNKSVKFTRDEMNKLKRLRKDFNCDEDFATEIGISRQVYQRLLLAESARQDTVEIVKEFLGKN